MPTSTVEPRPRAAAMAPEARRAAIVAATIPLLATHGRSVTTRQIAQAAGIAEGTIFRAFPDKESLVAAAVEAALDPAPDDAALAAIDPALPLEARLREATAILRRRVAGIWKLMTAVGPERASAVRTRRPPDLGALAGVFEPDRARLRLEPVACAQLLRGLVLAGSHPALAEEPFVPEELVSVLLDGIRVADARARTATRR